MGYIVTFEGGEVEAYATRRGRPVIPSRREQARRWRRFFKCALGYHGRWTLQALTWAHDGCAGHSASESE